MRNSLLALAMPLAIMLGVSACVAPGGHATCRDCGTVRAVDQINQAGGQASGAGALMGAVIGGVIGHQFGSGRGNDAATVGGAAAGAYAGHQAEKARSGAVSYYRITIDMDSGNTATVNVNHPAGLARGSRVRVVGQDVEVLDDRR